MTQTLQVFQTNLISPVVRRETRDGIDYLVAPAVILVEGVLNGALVTADEFGAFVDIWNDVPAPVYHPSANGRDVSARHLEVQEDWVIGRFYHAALEGKRLRGEFWLDLGRAERMGGDATEVVRMLEAGEPVEVSTGYFCNEEPAEGFFDGMPYTVIHRDLRPDHVALLPHSVGACSWRDGCGAPRVNEQAQADTDNEVIMTGKTFVALEISLDERLRRVYQAWDKHMASNAAPDQSWVFILEAYEDRIVVASDGGRYWQYPYTETADGITFGDPTEVEKTYAPITAQAQHQQTGEVDMNREELILNLAANCGCGRTEDQLRAMTDAELQVLAAQAPEEPETEVQETSVVEAQPVQEPETNDDEETEVQVETLDAATLETLRSLADAVRAVGAENFRNAIAGLVKNERQERDALVADIVANSAGQFQSADLSGMTTEVLRKMKAALAPQTNVGRGAGRMTLNAAQSEPKTIAMPSIWQ